MKTTSAHLLACLLVLAFSTVCQGGADALAPLTETEILRLMATVPDGLHCGTGVEWYSFERRQQHKSTVRILRTLYREHLDEVVQRRALSCLSHQKRSGLLGLWTGILRDDEQENAWLLAVRGLGVMNSEASNGSLLAILAEPTRPSQLIARVCTIVSHTKPEGGLESVLGLKHHRSPEVRLAALRASLALGTDRNDVFMRSLSDADASIVRWGLSGLGPNPPNFFVPLALDFLSSSNAFVRATADEALRRTLSHASTNTARRFAVFESAFTNRKWSFETAPLLTSRYAVILERHGRLDEAAIAYTTAQRAHASDAAYRAVNHNDGATMLYRLCQVRRKQGRLSDARDTLDRMASEYSGTEEVYLEDSPGVPGLGSHTSHTVDELTARLVPFLDCVPLSVSVSPVRSVVDVNESFRFNVTMRNLTDNTVTFDCARKRGKGPLMPAERPSVVVDARHWTGFEETPFGSDATHKMALAPDEAFTFAVSVSPRNLRGEAHVFDFTFPLTCKQDSGEAWKGRVLANSATIKLEYRESQQTDAAVQSEGAPSD